MNQVAIDQSRLPRGFTPNQQSSAFNNNMAQAMAAGDPRHQMKRYDRAGFSRGAAQANQAGINAAQEMTDGIAQAYRQQIDDSQYNAMAGLESQVSQEDFARQLGALQQQNAYAQQMANLQRQQAVFGALRGLLD
jgi:hypothetical protein